MYNKYAEAETLSMLPAVLRHFSQITFNSGSSKDLTKLCAMFRFPLSGISKGSLVCHLGQLEQLARYYMYGEQNEPDREHAETKMRKWLKTVDREIGTILPKKKIKRPLSSLDCTDYDLPFYSNIMSLDGILANALAAGPFDVWDKYPGCEHLSRCFDERMKNLNENEKAQQTELFWKIQLAGLSEAIAQDETDSDAAYARTLSVFCMMLDYAKKYPAYLEACEAFGIEPESGAVKFPIETSYISNVLFPFSSAENFRNTACKLPNNLFYGPVSVNIKNDTHNALGFMFFDGDNADSADFGGKIARMQLPDIRELDDGTRLFPDESHRSFCGIVLRMTNAERFEPTMDGVPKKDIAPRVNLTAMTLGMASGRFEPEKGIRDYYRISGLADFNAFTEELDERLKKKYTAFVCEYARISEEGMLAYRRRLARARTFAHLLAKRQLDHPECSDALPIQYYKSLGMLCEDNELANAYFNAEITFMEALEKLSCNGL